jgi:hypothetical protein
MIHGSGIYEFTLLVKDMTTLSPTGLGTTEVITELEGLVQELKKPHTHKDVMSHLSKINQKIDLIRESVQRLCESTANCTETTSYE